MTDERVGASGAYTTSVPIAVPPFHGLEPRLALAYSSAGGNGWLGVGWGLSGLSIVDRVSPGKGAPTFTGTDVFLLDGMELIPCPDEAVSPSCKYRVSRAYQAYTSRIERFQRVAFDPSASFGGSWYVWTKTGTKMIYRPSLSAGVPAANPASWHLASVEDTSGNTVRYHYWQNADPLGTGAEYLHDISYNGTIVAFYSESRPDIITSAIGRSLLVSRNRLKTIDITVGGKRSRAYALRYQPSGTTSRSMLAEIQQYGTDATLASGTVTGGTALPPTRLEAASSAGGVPNSWEGQSSLTGQWGPPWADGGGGNGKLNFNTDTSLPWFDEAGTGIRRWRQWFAGDVDADRRSDFMSVFLQHNPFSPGGAAGNSWWVAFRTALANRDGNGPNAYRVVEWSTNQPGAPGWHWSHDPGQDFLRAFPGDVNGDGKTDYLVVMRSDTTPSSAQVYLRVAISRGDGTFDLPSSPQALPVAWDPRDRFFAGDVNHDGKSDLMIAARQPVCDSATVAWAGCAPGSSFDHAALYAGLSNGDGTFAFAPAAQEPPWTFHPWDDAHWFAGDVNGDGETDFLRVVNHEPDSAPPAGEKHAAFEVAISAGDGTFEVKPTFETGIAWSTYVVPIPYFDQPYGSDLAQSGDFNGDGKTDLVIMTTRPNLGTGEHVVLYTGFSNGDGTFRMYVHDTATLGQNGLSARHLNYWLSARRGEPDFPNRWLTGDFNGDGATDLLVASPLDFNASQWPTTVDTTRLISNKNGSYIREPTTSTNWFQDCNDRALTINQSSCPDVLLDHVFAGDVNGDGTDDLMYAGLNSTASSAPSQRTSLRVEVSAKSALDAVRWLPADVDGQGVSDLVYPYYDNPGIRVFSLRPRAPQFGGYGMTSQPLNLTPELFNPSPHDWRVADVGSPTGNGPDGRDDLIYILFHDDGPADVGLRIYTLLSAGAGTWVAKPGQNILDGFTDRDTSNWHAMDVNGDGLVDLVHVHALPTGVRVTTLVANGDGSWTSRPDRDVPLTYGAADSRNWHPMDVNGDGKLDLVHLRYRAPGIGVSTLLSKDDGTWTVTEEPQQTGSGSDIGNWRPADANGDGKLDLVHVTFTHPGIRVQTLLSHGDGHWTRIPWCPSTTFTANDPQNWRPMDVNKDGRTDLVHLQALNPGLQVDLMLSLGDGSWQQRTPETKSDPTFTAPDTAFWQQAQADGDGRPDLIRVDYANPVLQVTSVMPRAPTDELTAWSNSTGGATTVAYRPSSSFSATDPAHGCYLPPQADINTVGTITTTDGRTPATPTVHYSYRCAHWSYRERGFLGWASVTADGGNTVNRSTRVQTTSYSISDTCLVQPQNLQLNDAIGQLYTRRITAYEPPGTSPPYNCQVFYTDDIEADQTATGRNVYTYYHHDEFGNVTATYEHNPKSAADDRNTTYGFLPATQPYIVGLPHEETVRKDQTTTPLRFTIFCYDGDTSYTCYHQPTTGLRTAVKRYFGNNLRSTDLFYDKYGTLSAVRDANGHGTSTTFDSVYHTFPDSTTNQLSQTEYRDWDPVLGQVVKLTDINHQPTTFTYDPLGRLRTTTLPSGGKKTLDYLDWGNPTSQRIKETQQDGTRDGLWTVTYLDGLGRTYRVVKKGDGTRLLQDTAYGDSSGQVYQQSDWYKSGSVPKFEVFEYDGAGRLARQNHPDGSYVAFGYGTDGTRTSVSSIDELGHTSVVYHDAYGRTTGVRRSGAGQSSQAAYTYDAADELLTITDDQGNVTTNTYDAVGNKTGVNDPDSGRAIYTYDPVGNVLTQTDAKTKTLTFTYDALDRIKTKTYPDNSQAVWTYDEPNHGASRGRLTSVTDPSAGSCPGGRSEDLRYNALGEITAQAKCIDGRAFTMGFGYDRLGRPRSVTYPDKQVVTYTYDLAGRLAGMPGYVNRLTFDPAGRPTDAQYANGTIATWTYDPNRKWLQTTTIRQGQNTLFDAAYTYYPNGQVQTTSSTTNKMNLAFTYDGLDRLTQVTGDVTQNLTYDSVGNITSNSTVGSYTYPPPGPTGCSVNGSPHPCSRPHAVETAGSQTLHYDNNGDLNSVHNNATQQDKGIDWTDDHQPEAITDFAGVVTRYTYDAPGDRVSRRRGNDYTRFYGRYLDYSTAGGLTKYYYAGSTLIARSDGSGTYWYHPDRLGSIRLITNRQGAIAQRYDYAPFGKPSSSTGTLNNDIQFTGQRSDTDNGLIYMNARYYDPSLGRFISPDTIIPDRLNPQALNEYSYSYNNPLSYIDPSGHQPEDPEGVQNEFIDRASETGGCTVDACLVEGNPRWPQTGLSEWTGWTDGTGGLSKPPMVAAPEFPPLTSEQIMQVYGKRYLLENIADINDALESPNPFLSLITRLSGRAGERLLDVAYEAGWLSQQDVEDVKITVGLVALAFAAEAEPNLAPLKGAASDVGFAAEAEPNLAPLKGAASDVGGTTRVGRWMSKSELDQMQQTGTVVEGGGGRTYVGTTPDPSDYKAGTGYYVEFDVPTSSLRDASQPNWAVIPGPNVGTTRYGPFPANMPPATNIQVVKGP